MNNNNDKTFNDFLSYRWNSTYKPIVMIGGILTLVGFIITGLIVGATEIWDMLQNLHPDVIKVGLPVFSVIALFVLIEYGAYKSFMATNSSFIPPLNTGEEE